MEVVSNLVIFLFLVAVIPVLHCHFVESCGEGQFNYTVINKCVLCSFTCKISEEMCGRYKCIDFMKKQCKPDEYFDSSVGRCSPCSNMSNEECRSVGFGKNALACGEGQYFESLLGQCLSCDTPCKIGRTVCKPHGCGGPPFAPSRFKIASVTAVAATVECISEFSGESEQKLYVQYKKCEEKWDIASEVPQGGIADPGFKKTVRFKVMNLEPSVCYSFRGRSKNSHPGPHTSKFSNEALGRTPDAPKTSVIGASSTQNKVTMRWEQVIGKYTAIKVKCCQTVTKYCLNYTVPNHEDTEATIFVDPNKTFYCHLVIEDNDDVVYMSKRLVVDESDPTIIIVPGISSLMGAAVLLGVIVLVVVCRTRRQVQCSRIGQHHHTANETEDNNESGRPLWPSTSDIKKVS